MGFVNRILAFVVMGMVALFTIALPIIFAMAWPPSTFGVVWPFLAVAAFVALICILAPSGRIAWGSLALINGLAFFIHPFSRIYFGPPSAIKYLIGPDPGSAGTTSIVGSITTSESLGLYRFILGAIFIALAFFILRGASRCIPPTPSTASAATPTTKTRPLGCIASRAARRRARRR